VAPLNARDINVELKMAGINIETMDDFTTSEIVDALGVDYLLIGSIDRTFEGDSSIATGFGSLN